MPPRNAGTLSCAEVDDELHIQPEESAGPQAQQLPKRPPTQIVWRNVIWFIYLHLAAVYGLYILPWAKWQTWIWCVACYAASGLGITAGAHRLWSHRSYKARLPLRIVLGVFNSMAFQNDIIEWSRDHRTHHKYSETNADPHNAKRGFFFAHVGWLLIRKHPEVKEKGKAIDMSDLLADPVCSIQRKFYLPSVLLLCFIVPAVVPWYCWGESAWTAFFTCSILRYALVLNFTWCVNSVAHLFGNKPYDRHINPAENLVVAFGAVGEGYHNYHHVFPYDYSTSEHGWRINFTTMFIDLMAAIGQVVERKKMSHEAIWRRKQRTGDGSSGFGISTPAQKAS